MEPGIDTPQTRTTALNVDRETVLAGLNDLLQLNHDAIGAYDIAIEKLDDSDHASQISGFKLDHERHIRELNKAIQDLGGMPVNEPHGTGPLKEAMQALGSLAGDKGTLIAWRTNELQVRTKYDRYASKAVHWAPELKRLIDEQALDEERHYRWVADALAAMGIGSGEGMEVDLSNRMRERMETVGAQAGRATEQIRERVESTAEYIRETDRDAMRADFEDRMRQNPMKTLAALFAVGFVVGRILR